MSAINVSEEFLKKFGKRFPPETYLAKEGDEGQTMFLINSGKLAVIKKTPAGEKILATLKSGEFFGEMALVGEQTHRAATVKSLTEVSVLELNRVAFEALIRRSPEIAMKVIAVLANRLRTSNGKLAALVHTNDFVRLGSYFHYLATDQGTPADPEGQGRVFIVDKASVSSNLGVSIDKVEQFLSLGHKANFIAPNGEWYWAPNPSYLQPFGELLSKLLKN